MEKALQDLSCECATLGRACSTNDSPPLIASRPHGLTRPSRLEVSNPYHPGVNIPQSDGRGQIAMRHQHCDQAQTTDGKPEP